MRTALASWLGLIAALPLAACHSAGSRPGLLPIEQPGSLQPAAPRISGVIPPERGVERVFASERSPARPVVSPEWKAPAGTQQGAVTLDFVDTDIREIARTILGKMLKVNYTIDPAVHGTASIETGRPLPRSALLPALETVLNQNGATLVRRDGLYAVVPIAAGVAGNPIFAASAIGAGTAVVPLRYASAKDMARLLTPYVSQGGKITADPAHNALIVSGDQTVRRALVALIEAFDIDVLAGQSYALFPAGENDPKKLAAEVEKVLEAQNGGALAGIIRVLPMERVNAVLVVSSQPRYINAARRFLALAARAEDATARSWHVYYVQNGKSTDLQNLLQRAFTPGHVTPTPAPGTTAPGSAQLTLGTGAATGFGRTSTGLGAGAAGTAAGSLGTGAQAGQMALAATPLRSEAPAQMPATEPLSPEAEGPEAANRIRIIADAANNSLLIYATPSEYSVIDGMLRKVDIVPLQVLIDATIAEVTLNDQLQYGTQFFFKVDHLLNQIGAPPSFAPLSGLPSANGFGGFVLSKSPAFALEALSAVTKVKVLSSPQVMVLDNQPARLQVGQQVPILTGTAQSTLVSGAPIVSSIDYRDTGVILQVTPRVNSGGLVTLDLAQEVSTVTQPAANTVQNSPTFDDRIIQTRVAIQDGQTVGLAGLIQDSDQQGNGGIPLLKDIPLLGSLVSSQGNLRSRRELLVLITPHVVHDQRDVRALTEDLRNQLINAALVPQQIEHHRPSGLANPNGL
ncbi:MAG TPA: type II secretion system secretin GspD [Stellaceae bacterium]|nr:type II secretion system secretin GspD [Stellaceae bacterium]